VNPPTITVHKNPSYPKTVAAMKNNKELWRRSRLHQVKYLNNILEQAHKRIKHEPVLRQGLAGSGRLDEQ
jgi:transposase-like protein